ncbi:xanthine dehydrogenase/oxidase-like [Penaeus indicus]|uniref:xanthine dehydrogenase/oxidase-like n=1 Tax=Penaeus indicus TaxID=29960 RepID=UPI00300C91D6
MSPAVQDERFSDTLVFFVNGRKIVDSSVDAGCTLLTYLRTKLLLTGTKLGCGEGGCGACTVMLSRYDPEQDTIKHYSVNACLTLVASVHGLAVTTVEGVGSLRQGLHPVQERLTRAHGSQCGFCTPGMVMAMYALLRNRPRPEWHELEQHLAGNLCRCTGYRPILDGFGTFCNDSNTGCGREKCCRLSATNGDCNGFVQNGFSNGEAQDGDEARGTEANALFPKEDFTPYDPSQDIIFPPELKLKTHLHHQPLKFQGPRVTYWRPTTLPHLLRLKCHHPEAKLVVGNTEVGVEVGFKNQTYPVLVNPSWVPELNSVKHVESGVVLGAAVSLARVQEILQEQVLLQPDWKTRNFSAVLEILRWFAGQQIRNVASFGGNIMTSSPISDLNPVLMMSGATLTLLSHEHGERRIVMDQNFFTGYRKNIVKPSEVLISVHLPYTQEDEYAQAYKQSRRRDDDIAIVNGAMRARFVPGTSQVEDLRVAFGGMAVTTVMAVKTAEGLRGCDWDEALLERAMALLLEDLPLDASAPGGMVEYRRALTLSLFFKFYLSVRKWLAARVPTLVMPLRPDEESAIAPYQRPPFASTQVFQQVDSSEKTHQPVGRPLVHASGYKQATGEAVYVDDMPRVERELFAALVLSTRAHAKILGINETPALREEGVEAFYCARDISQEKNQLGTFEPDEEVFASEKVTCVGQVLGVVVATDPAIARRAARLVRVDYQDLEPPVVTIEDAIKQESWWGPWKIVKGNLDHGFESAAHILEGEMRMGGQEHFYLEPNAHIFVPKGEDGEMDVFSSSQIPSAMQKMVARVTGVSSNRVVVRVKRVGGAFGGKESRVLGVAAPAAFAAARLSRPVRITLDRHEDMLITGGRHPFLCRWRVGVTAKGVFTALDVRLYSNGGCSQDLSPIVMHKAMMCIDNAYRHSNIRVTGYVCKTNLPSNTAFRGFGAPQAAMFAEDIVTTVARSLKLDPCQVRERNMYQEGDSTHINHTLERCTIRRCWEEVIAKSDLHIRQHLVQKFNKENTYKKRGLAIIPTKCGIAFDRVLNQAGALVQVYTDGSVLLTHGGIEMGQGLHTKILQIAAQVLKIPIENIHIMDTATDKVPNTSPTAASISTDINGMAVMNACKELRARLKPFIKRNPAGTWKSWVKEAYMERVSLSATGFHRIEEVTDFDFETMSGQPFHYYCNGAAVTEVEVDCLTGDHTILRTDLVMDVGQSLNPAIDVGQVEGAFVQGVGLVTLEELTYSPEGSLLARGPGAYKIPGFQDIPCEFHVSLLKDAPNPLAIFSSKGVGEPPLLLATSVFQAIKDAVGAARETQGLDRAFRLDSPATAERIRVACQGPLLRKIPPVELGSKKPWSVTV